MQQKLYLNISEIRFFVFFLFSSKFCDNFQVWNHVFPPSAFFSQFKWIKIIPLFSKSTRLMKLRCKIVGYYFTNTTIFALLSVLWASVTSCRFSALCDECVEKCVLVMVWFSFSFWWDRAAKCSRRDLKNIYTPLKQQNKIKTANYTHRTLNKINGYNIYQTNIHTRTLP